MNRKKAKEHSRSKTGKQVWADHLIAKAAAAEKLVEAARRHWRVLKMEQKQSRKAFKQAKKAARLAKKEAKVAMKALKPEVKNAQKVKSMSANLTPLSSATRAEIVYRTAEPEVAWADSAASH